MKGPAVIYKVARPKIGVCIEAFFTTREAAENFAEIIRIRPRLNPDNVRIYEYIRMPRELVKPKSIGWRPIA
jgi:hypothetical protein